MKILLVAEESAGIQLLRELSAWPYEVVGVVCQTRDRTNHVASLHNFAVQKGYRTWPAAFVTVPQFANFIRRAEVDVLLNVHSLHILNQAVTQAPKLGSYNLHPGPLPAYAGLHCPSWALYHGEKQYGVTLHKMTAKIDAGPVVARAQFPISDADTALSLYAKCVRRGLPLILKTLAVLAENPSALKERPQDLSKRRYFGKTVPQNGQICWERPAREIFNFIRACNYRPFPSPWGFPRAQLQGKRVGIVRAALTGVTASERPGTLAKINAGGLWIAAADEYLCVQKVCLNGKVMPVAQLLGPGFANPAAMSATK